MKEIILQSVIEAGDFLINENFKNNERNWETPNNENEHAYIKDSYYWMHNKSSEIWMYYKMRARLSRHEDYIVNVNFELLNKDEYSHFGIVWGFGSSLQNLNRFSVSADGKRITIMHFEHNHKKIYYRFQHWNKKKLLLKNSVSLSIIKQGNLFYFFVNKAIINVIHENHFACLSNYFGYYLEPGIAIKSNHFLVRKLQAETAFNERGFKQLLKP